VPDYGTEHADLRSRVAEGLREALASAGAAPPPVTVEPVEAIERDPATMSKLKLVRSELRASPPSA